MGNLAEVNKEISETLLRAVWMRRAMAGLRYPGALLAGKKGMAGK